MQFMHNVIAVIKSSPNTLLTNDDETEALLTVTT
jgi:hypothetical protein